MGILDARIETQSARWRMSMDCITATEYSALTISGRDGFVYVPNGRTIELNFNFVIADELSYLCEQQVLVQVGFTHGDIDSPPRDPFRPRLGHSYKPKTNLTKARVVR